MINEEPTEALIKLGNSPSAASEDGWASGRSYLLALGPLTSAGTTSRASSPGQEKPEGP